MAINPTDEYRNNRADSSSPDDWRQEYRRSTSKDAPVWVGGETSVRIMHGYRPNPNLLPDGWAIAIHKASGTRHTFYLRTSGARVVSEAEMRRKAAYGHGPRPNFPGERREREEFQPPVDREYMAEQLVRVIGELLGERYLVREAQLVPHVRRPFERLEEPFTLPSGAFVTPQRDRDPDGNGLTLGEFELTLCGASDRQEHLRLQVALPFPRDVDLRGIDFDFEGLVYQIAQQIREYRPAGGGSVLVWTPATSVMLRDPRNEVLVIDL